MTAKTIYVDMDGVLTNFEKCYLKKFGVTPQQASKDRINKKFSANWQKFIDDAEFARLEPLPGSDRLIKFLHEVAEDHNINLAILSSSGGFDNHYRVAEQKMQWLRDNNIKWPPIIVPSKKFKCRFADPVSFLIDDTPYNVETFRDAGGGSVLHTSVDNTILKLHDWIYD